MTFLPMVGRELTVTARRAGTYWLRFWEALVVLAIWLFLLANTRSATPAQMGQVLLNALGVLALGFSLFAGAFLTADCLSEEKREGTLGLLFLTDLKSHDDVLGKLAASSLNAFFGLLATFPILGLSLMLGGVTGNEFARLILVFVTTLFFSLGTGMFVSAVSRETRQTMGRAFLLVIIFAGLFPMLWWGQSLALGRPAADWLLLPSPAYAYLKAFDAHYRLWDGPREFWASVGTVFSLGLAGVVLAIWLLPRAWRNQDSAPEVKSKRPRRTAFFSKQTFQQRARWLDANPFYWLASRDAGSGRLALKILLALVPVWVIFFASIPLFRNYDAPFTIVVFSAYGLHQMVKLLIATEASRRMNEDRQSGALELLLATPISVEAILSGQKRALWRHFVLPWGILCALNLGLCMTVWPNGGLARMDEDVWAIFIEVFLGGVLVLVTDFHALCWVGMWRGLKTAKHHRAVAGTLGRVMGPSWLAAFLLVFVQPRFGGIGSVAATFGAWFVLGMVVDLVAGQCAAWQIRAEFREIVSQRFQGKAN